MSNRNLVIVLIILVVVCIGFTGWNWANTPKVAYVRSAELVNKFVGMKEAEKLYESKAVVWQANIDTLTYSLRKNVNDYEANYRTWSPAKKTEVQQSIQRQQQNLEQYKSSIEEQAAEEKDKITQGALNQINAYIEKYSKEKGYDLVVGVTLSGNVLYGEESIDITEDIIKGINAQYKK